jgi:hypothetical protein
MLWTLFGFCMGAIGWISVIYSIKKNTKEPQGDFLKMLGMGAIGFLFLAVGSFELSFQYNEISQCRNLDLNQVKAIRVREMPNESSFTGSTILFNNAGKTQEGLRLLRNSTRGERRMINGTREKFIYGYQIQLILENDSSAPVLYYFPETDNSQKTDVVIPVCGNNSDEIKSTDDIYFSSTYGAWLRENIEPLFKQTQ